MRNILLTCAAIAITAQPANAADDAAVAALGALAGTAAEGKTELGSGAGDFASWAMVSRMLTHAAKTVDGASKETSSERKVLILVGDQSFSPAPYWFVRNRLEKHDTEVADANQKVKCFKGPEASSFTPEVASQILSLFKRDVTYSETKIEPSEEMWSNAQAQALKVSGWAVYLNHFLVPDPNAAVAQHWQTLREDVDTLTKCNKKHPLVVKLRADIAADEELFGAAKDGEPSMMDKATALDSLVAGDDYWVLRSQIESAGSITVQEKNLLTSFGYPAIHMQPGIVLTYRWAHYTQQNGFDSNGVPKSAKLPELTSGTVLCLGKRETLKNAMRTALSKSEGCKLVE